MNVYLYVILRTVHIFAGALWIGAVVLYLFFIKPSVKSIGPAGPQFMEYLAGRRRLPLFMVSMSLVTVLAGGALYLSDSSRLSLYWIKSGPGMGFTIGAVAALGAFIVGNFGIGPTAARMGALGQQITASDKPPTDDQLSSMGALERRLARAEAIDMVLLTFAMLSMITARYWGVFMS